MDEQTRSSDPVKTTQRSVRRTRIGVVESDSGNKTLKVRIDRVMKHPKYGKYLKRRSVLHAHDEENLAHRGDLVEIMECRPISKTKSWRLCRVLRPFART